MEDNWGLSGTNGPNCTLPAIDDFPRDLFTDEQRQSGAVVLHVLASLYLFVALAVVCDKYFVPAVEKICQALNMSNDVAGATFMAAATSAPELFVNVIGTFITEGDIGIGTIVGSAVFNILAVAACCGICATSVIPLDWWPLTRDCVAYGVTVAILICIMHDERVEWYEALTLVLLYIVYILIMYFDKTFQKCAKGGMNQTRTHNSSQDSSLQTKNITEQGVVETKFACLKIEHYQQNGNVNTELTAVPGNEKISAGNEKISAGYEKNSAGNEKISANNKSSSDTIKNDVKVEMNESNVMSSVNVTSPEILELEEENYSLIRYPKGKSCFIQITWFITWPIHLLFFFTIPDCTKTKKKIFPLTFLMCIVWIGSLSYVVAWMITIIGHTLKIPDSVMGITFLAAGTSVPEAVSSVIVAKQGHASMGICNSIGSNTFDILICLGVPWLIKAAFLPITTGHNWVEINSAGLEYSAITLLSTLFLLYITFSANKFRLDKRVGLACLFMYLVFLVFASLIELNVFFRVNLPTCGRS